MRNGGWGIKDVVNGQYASRWASIAQGVIEEGLGQGERRAWKEREMCGEITSVADGIEEDIRSGLIDRLGVQLRDGGADGGGESTAGRVVWEGEAAHVFAMHPAGHQTVSLAKVEELGTACNIEFHGLVKVGLELGHILLVVVTVAVVVEERLAPDACVVPFVARLPPPHCIHHLTCGHLVAGVEHVLATTKGGRQDVGRRWSGRESGILVHGRSDGLRSGCDVHRRIREALSSTA